MSRKFSNVLVVCALVLVLALLVTGTTLAVYESLSNTVNAYAVFVDGASENDDKTGAYANISCGSTSGAEISVSLGHKKIATLVADYNTNAYTFVGWFEGDKVAYNAAFADAGSVDSMIADGTIVTGSSIDVSMEADSSWCAVYQVIKYSISYSYDADPEDSTENVTVEDATVAYGTELKTLTSTTNYEFVGWTATQDGSALEGKYVYANFNTDASKTITLTDPFVKIDYTQTEVTATVFVVDAAGNETAEATYSATSVKFKLLETDELSNLLTASNWTAKYSFWSVDGISLSYNETPYTNAYDLAYAILTDSDAKYESYADVTIYAVPTITKDLSTMSITSLYAKAAHADTNINMLIDFDNSCYSGTVKVEDYTFTYSYNGDLTNQLTMLYQDETPTASFSYDLSSYNVEIYGIRLYNSEGKYYDFILSTVATRYETDATALTLNDIIQFYIDVYGYTYTSGATPTFTSGYLYFVTTEVAE